MTARGSDCWVSTTFGRLARIRNGADSSSVEVEAGGYPVYGSGGEFRRASSFLFDGESVLFGRKGTVDRPLYVSGKFWTVDTMFYSVIDKSRLIPRFAYYWATTLPFGEWATDTALPSMTSTALKAAPINLPSVPGQRAIAAYLDRETAQIDAFIAKNEELITLLTERRLALIARAAFRGLDLAASTRDSGIEWLGEVPIHWDVSRLSRWFSVVLGKMLDASKFASTDGKTLPYVRAANVKQGRLDLSDVKSMPFTANEQVKLDLRGGDLVVVEGGASYGAGAYISIDMAGWGFQKTVNRVRSRGGHSTKFLGLQLEVLRHSGVLGMLADASTIPHLTAEKLERLCVSMPPIAEQLDVVEYVEKRTCAIQSAVEAAARGVVLARERRAALISAAVAGKIDVGVAT